MCKFENRMEVLGSSVESLKFIDPIEDVTTTLETVKFFFDKLEVSYTASDLVAATSLILGQVKR